MKAKREKGKRLSLALDGETYKRLRRYAAETDQTHQAILETALAEFLDSDVESEYFNDEQTGAPRYGWEHEIDDDVFDRVDWMLPDHIDLLGIAVGNMETRGGALISRNIKADSVTDEDVSRDILDDAQAQYDYVRREVYGEDEE